MPIAELQMPDGRIAQLEVPEGTTQEQVMQFVSSMDTGGGGGWGEGEDPTQGMSGTEKYLAGTGKAFVDTARAAQQLGVDVPLGGQRFEQLTPEALAQREAGLEQEIAESRRLDAPLMETGAGQLGNITGNLAVAAPTMMIPGAATVRGSALIGGGLGALEPTVGDESRLGNAGKSAVMSGGMTLGMKGLGRVLRPKPKASVKKLLDEGIELTPGQILGGGRIEEGATSVPVLGDVIRGAQKRGIESFNIAAINRSLKPIGKALEKGTPVGREAVKRAYTHIDKYYDDLLPKLAGQLDDTLIEGIEASTKEAIGSMPPARVEQFEKIIANNVLSKFDDTGAISGEGLKDVQKRVGGLLRRYMKSADPDQQILADALSGVKESIDDMILRSNPKYASQLKGADTAYATLLRIERAAGSTGAKEGVFTPAQLKSAIRAMDSSLRKRQFTQGGALMQDFAENAQGVLAKELPDSGTAYRLMLPYLVGGGAAYAGQEGYISPGTAAAIAGGALAYTKPGQRIMTNILTKRPDILQKLGGAVSQAAAPVGVAVGSTASEPDYKAIAKDLRDEIQRVKTSRMPRRSKTMEIDRLKKEMSGVFKEAGKNLPIEDFRELRSSVR